MYYSLIVFILSIFIIILLLYRIKYRTEIKFKIHELTPKGRSFFPWLSKYELPATGEIAVSRAKPKRWELIAMALSSISAACSIVDFLISNADYIIKMVRG